MKEQFVTYEIALSLKELGFDEECLVYFNNDKYRDLICTCENGMDGDFTVHHYSGDVNAPLWQQVIDWFRETYKINILIAPIYSSENLKGYVFNFGLITMDNLSEVFKNGKFETFYKAQEQAILKAIELCQKEK